MYFVFVQSQSAAQHTVLIVQPRAVTNCKQSVRACLQRPMKYDIEATLAYQHSTASVILHTKVLFFTKEVLDLNRLLEGNVQVLCKSMRCVRQSGQSVTGAVRLCLPSHSYSLTLYTASMTDSRWVRLLLALSHLYANLLTQSVRQTAQLNSQGTKHPYCSIFYTLRSRSSHWLAICL